MVARNEMDSGELMLIIEFVMKLSCINSRWLSSLHSCTVMSDLCNWECCTRQGHTGSAGMPSAFPLPVSRHVVR
jgi:hypothetical protein